jgi:hypothetical protein
MQADEDFTLAQQLNYAGSLIRQDLKVISFFSIIVIAITRTVTCTVISAILFSYPLLCI